MPRTSTANKTTTRKKTTTSKAKAKPAERKSRCIGAAHYKENRNGGEYLRVSVHTEQLQELIKSGEATHDGWLNLNIVTGRDGKLKVYPNKQMKKADASASASVEQITAIVTAVMQQMG